MLRIQRAAALATYRHATFLFASFIALSGCGPAAGPISTHENVASEAADTAPITPIPLDTNPDRERIELGKLLFNDRRLSADNTIACSNCHDLRNGGDDGRPISTGIAGRPGLTNAPTVLNSRFNYTLFWDGRADSYAEQISATLGNPNEMDTSLTEVRNKLATDDQLAALFDEIYPGGMTEENIADALAAYLSALNTPASPFDRYLSGDARAIEPEALNGYRQFQQLGCISCHQGRNIGGNLYQRFGVMGDYFSDRGDVSAADYGRYNVTGRESDRFRFRVPSLRNVADTAPYFHDGSVATLPEAVAVMLRYQLGRPAEPEQISEIVAFLESLSAPLEDSLL